MFNRKYIFKGSIFHCYVSLPECTFPKNNSLQFTVYQNRPVLPKQERFVWPNYHIFKSYVSVSWRVCHQLKIWNSCQHVLRQKYQLGVCVCPHFPHTKHFGAPSWKNIPPFSLPFWWKQNICLVWWHFLWQESFTLKKTKSKFQEFGRVPILLCWSIGLLYLDLLKMLQKRGQTESGEKW